MRIIVRYSLLPLFDHPPFDALHAQEAPGWVSTETLKPSRPPAERLSKGAGAKSSSNQGGNAANDEDQLFETKEFV
jgi:hypothetical protein